MTRPSDTDIKDAALDRMRRGIASRDRAAINAAVADLLDAGAPLGPTWRSIVQMMMQHGEIGLALRAMAAFVAASGHVASARFEQAALLARSGRLDQARLSLARIPGTVPSVPEHAFLAGTIALDLGDVAQARRQFAIATAAQPASGQSWHALAMSGAASDDEATGDRLLGAAPALAQAQPLDRAAYLYATGHVLAARGEHEAAFDAFSAGAAIMTRLSPHDAAADRRNAESARACPDEEIARRLARTARFARPAIVVCGLPRSGTTLVEQILASHSGVGGGGELNVARIVAEEAGSVAAAGLDDTRLDELGALYAHLVAERVGTHGLAIDKTLNGSRFLALIAGIAPDAPIVWMRRDPLDCAWSCFRTFFAGGAAWSYDLEAIAHHFRLEDELFAYWQPRLGARLLTIDYATLVEDLPTTVRTILAHCGLAEEAGPFAPHETVRAVTTSSVMQVREPVNRRGLGVAEPYRSRLDLFVRAYAG